MNLSGKTLRELAELVGEDGTLVIETGDEQPQQDEAKTWNEKLAEDIRTVRGYGQSTKSPTMATPVVSWRLVGDGEPKLVTLSQDRLSVYRSVVGKDLGRIDENGLVVES